MLIGYLPNSDDCMHPGDRRRSVFYFKEKGVQFEVADFDKYYEVLIVTIGADLGLWSKYKQNHTNKTTRVIFDLSDAYLSGEGIKNILRAIYHYISGKTSVFTGSYKNTLINMMNNSDAIICGSVEQQSILHKYHRNVDYVTDYFQDDILSTKSKYEITREGEVHILWEGFSHGNAEIFVMLKNILHNLSDFRAHLHIVTDPLYCKVGTSYFCKTTYSMLMSVFKNTDIKIHLYDWNKYTFSSIASMCDMALIPIPDDPVMYNKPENKLLLLWNIGLPVITSPTPAYKRVFERINEPMVCDDYDEWRIAINKMQSDKEYREEYMNKAKQYIKNYCTKHEILKVWDRIVTKAKQENI